jgi:hypothetical protein
LGVNQYGGWIDSVEVSADGATLYYGFYPGADLLTDSATGQLKGDNDIYVSQAPFDTHRPVNQYFMSEVPWSACCVHRDAEGHFWYNSNREARPEGSAPGAYDWHPVFRDATLMPFNKRGRQMGDVFYSTPQDELWLHEERGGLLVLMHAKAGQFRGAPTAAPRPLREGRQPFLTPDGLTLYFTANYGDVPSAGPAIYRARRTGAHQWSPPEPVVWASTGVGEPTLTADGRQLFFVQLFRNAGGAHRIAVFSVTWQAGDRRLADTLP